MRYRYSSTKYRSYKHAQAIEMLHQKPDLKQVVQHLSNRYQASILHGLSTYVLNTATFARSGTPLTDVTLEGGFRKGQVKGTNFGIQACHVAFGDPRMGNFFLREMPASKSNQYLIGRVSMWTELLHEGVNRADSRTERVGLRSAGGTFLTQIARAARGSAHDPARGYKLVEEAFHEILLPLAEKGYAAATAEFETRERDSDDSGEYSRARSLGLSLPTDFNVSFSRWDVETASELFPYMRDWCDRGTFIVPSYYSAPSPQETSAVEGETLDVYQQFSRDVASQSGPISAKPLVLEKEKGKTIVERIASNERDVERGRSRDELTQPNSETSSAKV